MCLEQSLVNHCSPTLAGIKVASLYRFLMEDRQAFASDYKRLRQKLRRQGLALVILKGFRDSRYFLLYVYRPAELERLLAEPETAAYLTGQGYDLTGGLRKTLCQLVGRVCFQETFPHEIGLFLGYPLEDVQGFVEHQGRDYTCRGLWKVYGDPAAAQRRFSSYRSCTEDYRRRYAAGTPITKLIVA
ncbi:MAG: DUF3793 family protein [Clostridiales bacterium]|nr:DUF3793 family protein [Clostridiales bacterium]